MLGCRPGAPSWEASTLLTQSKETVLSDSRTVKVSQPPRHSSNARQSQDLTLSSSDRGKQIVNTGTPGLLRLPPELRNHIYELVLPEDACLASMGYLRFNAPEVFRRELARIYLQRPSAHSAKPTLWPLLQVCRTIRYEAMLMPSAHNVPILNLRNDDGSYERSLAWLESADARAIACTRKAVVRGYYRCPWAHPRGSKPTGILFAFEVGLSVVNGQTGIRSCGIWLSGCAHHRHEELKPLRNARIESLAASFVERGAAEQWDAGRHKAEMVRLLKSMHREAAMRERVAISESWYWWALAKSVNLLLWLLQVSTRPH